MEVILVMDKHKLLKVLKNSDFISELIKAKTDYEFSELFFKYKINANDLEVSALKNIVYATKRNILRKSKISDEELNEITGGKSNICKYITRPLYFTGYATGYTIGKTPVIGSAIYYSITDAIRGFYESLHNY